MMTSGRTPRPPLAAAALLAVLALGCGTERQPDTAPPDTAAAPTEPAPADSAAAIVATTVPADTTAPPALAAAQTVAGYYQAIDQQRFRVAYSLWANQGGASGQSFKQFREGFRNTVGVSALLREPAPVADDSVRVPITLLAVVNLPDDSQAVRRYSGSYMVTREGEGWRLMAADLKESVKPLPPTPTGDPLALLRGYLAALNERDFARAYSLWDHTGLATGQTLREFAAGFAHTARERASFGEPRLEGAAGNLYATVPVSLTATTDAGERQHFCGTVDLHRLNLPPWKSLGWRIHRAQLRPDSVPCPPKP